MIQKSLMTAAICFLIPLVGQAAPEGPNEKKTELPTLESLHNQLKDIQLSMQTIKASDADLRLRKLEAEIAILKDHLSKIEASVGKLSTSRVAGSYTPPVAATATYKIVNTSPFGASVIINGKAMRVAAFQTVTLPSQNVGDFTYEVHADGFGLIFPNTTRSVSSNETFTISIYPR